MSTDYLVPLLCVLFCLLCLFCIIVCIWWTRKRRKERERNNRPATDENVNNQWEPVPLVMGRQQLKESNKEAEQERKRLMESSFRTCDGAEEGEEEDEEEEEEEEETEAEFEYEEECEGAVGQEQPVYKYSKTTVQSSGGVICTLHSSPSPLKDPHRTLGYSTKDIHWKNVSAVQELRDHCV